MANSGLAACPHSTLYPRAGGAGSTWTNSHSDEATFFWQRKKSQYLISSKIWREKVLGRTLTKLCPQWTWESAVQGSGKQARETDCLVLTQFSHMPSVGLEQGSYTLWLVKGGLWSYQDDWFWWGLSELALVCDITTLVNSSKCADADVLIHGQHLENPCQVPLSMELSRQ